MKFLRSAGMGVALAVMLTGCAMNAPHYAPSIDNVESIKRIGNFTAKVGQVEAPVTPATPATLSIRGSSMASPNPPSYGAYVAEALKQELSMANKLKTDAGTEISGTLVKNDIDASGFSTGTATISARFVVNKDGKVVFERVKSVDHKWDSSFVGAVAIPNALIGYRDTVQKLLAALYADPDFSNSLK